MKVWFKEHGWWKEQIDHKTFKKYLSRSSSSSNPEVSICATASSELLEVRGRTYFRPYFFSNTLKYIQNESIHLLCYCFDNKDAFHAGFERKEKCH